MEEPEAMMTKERIAELKKEVVDFSLDDVCFSEEVVTECLDEIERLQGELDAANQHVKILRDQRNAGGSWEYDVVRTSMESDLDRMQAMGAEGWELCAITWNRFGPGMISWWKRLCLKKSQTQTGS